MEEINKRVGAQLMRATVAASAMCAEQDVAKNECGQNRQARRALKAAKRRDARKVTKLRAELTRLDSQIARLES